MQSSFEGSDSEQSLKISGKIAWAAKISASSKPARYSTTEDESESAWVLRNTESWMVRQRWYVTGSRKIDREFRFKVRIVSSMAIGGSAMNRSSTSIKSSAADGLFEFWRKYSSVFASGVTSSLRLVWMAAGVSELVKGSRSGDNKSKQDCMKADSCV